MGVLVAQSARSGQEQQVILPSRVIAALSQLEPHEQAAVRAAFGSLSREGTHPIPGVDVRKLATPGPLYVLYLDAAPDVLILVRAPLDAPIEIVDIVRPEALRSLFHPR